MTANDTDQTIFRAADNRDVPFTQIANAMIDDDRLLPLAKLALVIVLSRPRNWDTHPAWLFKRLGVGRNKGYEVVNNLIEHKYCARRDRIRENDGTMGAYVYLFTDMPGTIPDVVGVSQADPQPRPPQRDKAPRPQTPRPSRRHSTNKESTNNKYRKGGPTNLEVKGNPELPQTITPKHFAWKYWLERLRAEGKRKLADEIELAGGMVAPSLFPKATLSELPKALKTSQAFAEKVVGRAA